MNCDDFPGRLRDICRGYDDERIPVLTPEKCERYRKFFLDGQFGMLHAKAANAIQKTPEKRAAQRAAAARANEKRRIRGSECWAELHQYALSTAWDASSARAWLVKWESTIPAFGCSCQANWKRTKASLPPRFENRPAFFQWTVEAHNFVSTHHVKPENATMSLEEAIARWGC